MLTREQNQRFTAVGPGTSVGERLRRYWREGGSAPAPPASTVR